MSIQLSRRAFLRGVVTTAGIAVAPGILQAVQVPFLWGDGIHDDTRALQAFFDGEAIGTSEGIIAEPWNAGKLLQRGMFMISDTLKIPSRTVITECRFRASDDWREGNFMLDFAAGSEASYIQHCHFNFTNRPGVEGIAVQAPPCWRIQHPMNSPLLYPSLKQTCG